MLLRSQPAAIVDLSDHPAPVQPVPRPAHRLQLLLEGDQRRRGPHRQLPGRQRRSPPGGGADAGQAVDEAAPPTGHFARGGRPYRGNREPGAADVRPGLRQPGAGRDHRLERLPRHRSDAVDARLELRGGELAVSGG